MPRAARIKFNGGIYHIIVRGISEINLFKTNREKEVYLKYIKKYQDIFQFKVYGFCLMSTHAHLIIGSNGADISKFMHGINGSYVKYFNRKHDRHGHALAERFKSKLVTSDTYLMNASLYVHRNPKDIQEYKNKIDKYKYSSIASYIQSISNEVSLVPVDTSLILMQINKDTNRAKDIYRQLVINNEIKDTANKKDLKNLNAISNTYEYLSGKRYMFRNINPDRIIEFVSKSLNTKKEYINVKYKKYPARLRALTVLFMRCFCDMKVKEICDFIGNLTTSQVSYLCNKGYRIASEKKEYGNIMNKFITEFSLAK